ncbi:molybdenum cofactor guanylyltransferase [Luteimonas gilva]|uniref:Molybdenum cofactor guanylyltransferase n=1 Tax=Luteimonas gilva TaxID=2572684 RepID=A0A4U5JYK4_9GAMM|nr:molybdenum cofactor guanylyltransferase [Luteimonas gilva]TKR33327.1 molybdenum cofactor guanylyltransferase [Luteimonas gilva]
MIASDVTLGLIAGGLATRLGGIDKAWLSRDGEPQVRRLIRIFADRVGSVLISANRGASRYSDIGLRTVPDRVLGIGPLGGLDALAQACASPWLLTLPVDTVSAEGSLLPPLAAAGDRGAYARDDDGIQPLIALWPAAALRDAAARAVDADEYAIHALQTRLNMACVAFPGVRFGNLNTPDDLAAAGIDPP